MKAVYLITSHPKQKHQNLKRALVYNYFRFIQLQRVSFCNITDNNKNTHTYIHINTHRFAAVVGVKLR